MKTQTEKTGSQQARPRLSRLFLTGCMVACITAGWLLGSVTTEAFSQSTTQRPNCKDSTNLLSIPMNGEKLPTMLLNEFAVIAAQP